VLRSFERILRRAGHEPILASDAAECLQIVAEQSLDLVLCDNHMPDTMGVDLIPQIHALEPDLPVIMVTGQADRATTIDALDSGAFWFFEKPVNPPLMARMVDKATDVRRKSLRLKVQEEKIENLTSLLQAEHKLESIIGKSAALEAVLSTVAKVAETDSTVLITGESGTGKELVARAIHYNSPRSKMPLVTVNCGAIPEELLESELFGHVKGAFTNAVANRKGRFEAANGGTIFLDEIGDMSPTLQVKLLRVLQERTYEPVGSSTTQHADVRVIAATHQNLESLIEEKRFREDLFYRLNVLPIRVPPLRERDGDVLLLAHHFLDLANGRHGMRRVSISDAVMERLALYAWPGNIRQLENCIERMVVLQREGEIDLDLLPPEIAGATPPAGIAPRVPPEGLRFNEVVDQVETDLILQALEQTQWNKNQAASRLGLNRTTLLEKIKKKGLRPAEA